MTITPTSNGRRLRGSGSKADQFQGGPARQGNGRLPSTAKHRRSGMIGLAVLLIVGSAAVAGLLAVRIDSRSAVIVAARPIAIGQLITQADLGEARVASEGLSLISVADSGQVIGRYAGQAIPQGRLVDAQMLQQEGFLKSGVVAVGVSVPPGRMPANGLQAGDRVQIVQVVEGVPKVLVAVAVISTPPAAASSSSSSSGLIPGGSSQGPGGVATVIVTAAEAPAVAGASAANQLSLVLVERGAQLGG